MFVRAQGRVVGSWGDFACFSTYIAHLITTGIGGLATTDSKELWTLFRSIINHGRNPIYITIDDDDATRDDPERFLNIVRNRYDFVRFGQSSRATEMEAALGCAQLERYEETMATRKALAIRLLDGLRDLEQKGLLQLPSVPDGFEHAFMFFPLVWMGENAAYRDVIVEHLERNNIETRYLLPLVSQRVYRKIFGDLEPTLPVTRWLNQRGFYVGLHHLLAPEDIDYAIDELHKAIQT